jgi:hypothetical protein
MIPTMTMQTADAINVYSTAAEPLVSFAKRSKSDITFLVARIMTSGSVLPEAMWEG